MPMITAVRQLIGALALLALVPLPSWAAQLQGVATLGGEPLVAAPVILWQTDGESGADQLGAAVTDENGSFTFSRLDGANEDGLFYLTAAHVENNQVMLMSAIGPRLQEQVFINELTTIATIFTHAQFMNGVDIRGNQRGLLIAAANMPNLVDPLTGTWGEAVLSPLNARENNSLAKLNTLASLITAYHRTEDEVWADAFERLALPVQQDRSVPPTTIDVIAAIAQQPWIGAPDIYDLFDRAFPVPEGGQRREAPFVPYLDFRPRDFAMILAFAGGGINAPARLAVDRWGNVWSGQVWMQGSLSSPGQNIGGGLAKLGPNGEPKSPAPTGWTAGDLNGVDWGVANAYDAIWVGSLNGEISKFNFAGDLIGTSEDSKLNGEIQQITGVSGAASEDVWAADAQGNQLIYFRNGNTENGKIIVVDGLDRPFGVVVDDEDRVWVGNGGSDTVLRFNAGDPSKAKSIKVPNAPRGLAIDSLGNIWVASALSPDTPLPEPREGEPALSTFDRIIEQFLAEKDSHAPQGRIYAIRPDGELITAEGFAGDGALDMPWSVSVDGNDDIWIASLWNRSVVLMAGVTRGETSLNTQVGTVLHSFQSGSIKGVTDVATDTAGNLWIANTWDDFSQAPETSNLVGPRKIWRGGGTLAVIYGVATPVHTPIIGQTRRP
ncbi:hypothetical protein PUV47_13355 [Pseudovibrio exalbescens]|uniref:hypothetical protein n=1 Tax=Pseudovibrio exalbescens TaxID=197461 RepID=UPI0023670F88|nr:hypothetical protein [Pseudovibrio exalbescens]MDD7910909.1 hypothetical protein [Pseudovibrio exalbescens]